jgi:hypothetical protein
MPSPTTRADAIASVLRLFQELHPRATLHDFDAADRHHVLQVAITGAVGKPFRVPRRLVDRAPENAWVANTLRRILKAELQLLRAQWSSKARVALFDRPVPRDEPLFLRAGQVVHVRCFVGRPTGPPGHAA